MTWPWLARSAHDEVVATLKDERDRLRVQVDQLLDQIVRLARKEQGMSEITPQKKREPAVVLPAAARELCEAWSDPTIQREMERRMKAMYRNTQNWSEVIEYFRTELEPAELDPDLPHVIASQ